MKNIILIGMRGSGKSSLGHKIAKTMKRRFADTDREIEKREHMAISRVVNKKGWNYFRKVEKYAIRHVGNLTGAVISTGGGAILDKENVAKLSRNGVFIYIKVPIDLLAKRLEGDSERPSLGKDLAKIYEDRSKIYESLADLTLEITEDSDDYKSDLKENAHRLVKLLEAYSPEFTREGLDA